MRRVAIAFTGAALFVGGLDVSPTFAAENPQTSAGPSIDPIAPNAGPHIRAYLRSFSNFEVISSAVPEDVGTAANADGLPERLGVLTRLGNAHEFRHATTGSPMG